MATSGVYAILNTRTNKIYIGHSTNLEKRQRDHFNLLRRGVHRNAHLQSAYNRDGQHVFMFQIIELAARERLVHLEQFWIDFYNAAHRNFGYNIRPRADCTTVADETRRRVSRAHKLRGTKPPSRKGVKQTLQALALKSEAMKRHFQGDKGMARRLEISQFHKGRKRSAETRQRQSAAAKERETRKRNGYHVPVATPNRERADDDKLFNLMLQGCY